MNPYRSLDDRIRAAAKARREYIVAITPTCRLMADVKGLFPTTVIAIEGGMFEPMPLPPEAQAIIDKGKAHIEELRKMFMDRYPGLDWDVDKFVDRTECVEEDDGSD